MKKDYKNYWIKVYTGMTIMLNTEAQAKAALNQSNSFDEFIKNINSIFEFKMD